MQEQYEVGDENFTVYTESGNKIIKIYDKIEDFSKGLAAVKFNGKWGYIDTTGKVVIPLKYDSARDYSRGLKGLAPVKLNGKWGYIDTTGKEVIPLKYDSVMNFYTDLSPVKLNGKWGYIDMTGKEVIPLKYDDAYSFTEGLARVKFNSEYFDEKYFTEKYFREGLARVKLNGKYGFIDKTGVWQGGPEPTTAPSGGCLWVVVFFTTLLTLACSY